MIGEDHTTTGHGWFAFSAPLLPYSSLAAGNIPTTEPQSGFCTGSFKEVYWPHGHSVGTVPWRSYCGLGDDNTGWMASAPFRAGSYATFYIAGYPGSPRIHLALENINTKNQLPLHVFATPREMWRLYHFPIPSQWKGQPVRLLAEDRATGPAGWVAFAAIPPRQWKRDTKLACRLVAKVLLLLLITVLPAIAVCIRATRKRPGSSLDLTALALLTIGLVGYAAFWCYFWSRSAGLVYSYGVLALSAAVILRGLLNGKGRRQLAALRGLLIPLALVTTASVCIVSLGFLYGNPEIVQEYAAARFSPPAPSIDNFLSKILADYVYDGHIPKPMAGDWLSSDRPPLQAGMALWHYAWIRSNRELGYQVLGTILQLMFLAGLWAYLDEAGVSRKAIGLVVATAFFSGFTIFNSFFVWPKLLPVAFLFIICGYFFTEKYSQVRADWRVGLLVGAAAAFAMLSHGGSVFGLLGIALTALILRRRPSLRFLAAAALAAALLYLPWFLYQKYYDPPGDRLPKMYLAGMSDEPHPETKLLDALIANYKRAKWYGVDNKIENFEALFDNTPGSRRLGLVSRTLLTGSPQQRSAAVASLRETIFHRWFWSIDLFSFVLVLWLLSMAFSRRQSSSEYRQACILSLCTGVTLIAWCLVMFGGTIVHQGCYLTEITAFSAGVLGLWALRPLLAVIAVACHVLFTVWIYVLLKPSQVPGFATYVGPANRALASAAALAAALFIWVLWRSSQASKENPNPTLNEWP